MAQLGDFISRLFTNGRTQGLSGGAGGVIGHDPAAQFYGLRMRRHRTDADLAEDFGALWESAAPQRGAGLRAHLVAVRDEGPGAFTDVLVVINAADAARVGLGRTDAMSDWAGTAEGALVERFTEWAAAERFVPNDPLRPAGFRFVEDGAGEMDGDALGLDPGEFVTVLVPNLYAAPGPASRPLLAVHLNLPGMWEGYRDVGRLWSDQSLFTLGRHWLDNASHPALREPALYRLQQYPDGSLVHLVAPELQDRYVVRSDALESGASVLTLAERGGEAVAYIVLAVVDEAASSSEAPSSVPSAVAASAHDAEDAESQTIVAPSLASGDGLDIAALRRLAAEPAALSDAPAAPGSPIVPASRPSVVADGSDSGVFGLETGARPRMQRTVIPEAVDARILTLQERGALLQRVHFAHFMDGYDVFIGAGGRVATQMDAPLVTISVRGERVSITTHGHGVRIDGEPLAEGAAVPLFKDVALEVDDHAFLYRDLTRVAAAGWPYLGELRRPGAGTYLAFGDRHRIGRDRRCSVRLPDEPHNENIAWKAAIGGGAIIRSKNGDIPKSRFYTDSIMVASEHAEVDLSGEPVLRSLARSCYTFVRRDGVVHALAPREGGRDATRDMALAAGDELLVGNCLFSVAYPPASEPAGLPSPGALPPVPVLVTDETGLLPVFSGSSEATLPLPLGPRVSRTVDVVAAAGLGERGPAPRALAGVTARSLVGDAIGVVPSAAGDALPSRAATPATAALRGEPQPGPMSEPASLTGAPIRAVLPEPAVIAPPNASTPSPDLTADLYAPHVDGDVCSVDEAAWSMEVARPARLVLEGWAVSGECLVGNHVGADIVVPEVRAFPDQAFLTLDYFRVAVRGRKGTVTLLQPGDARIVVDGREVDACDASSAALLSIMRRDAELEPDFDVELRLADDPSLPDPRARLLAIELGERLVRALFTIGIGRGAPRRVRLGAIDAEVRFEGDALVLANYLASYRLADGAYRPFFARSVDGPYRTLPEDGAPVTLAVGARVLAGNAVYRFEVG